MFIRVDVMDEESTSVFVPNVEDLEESEIIEGEVELDQAETDQQQAEPEEAELESQVDASILRRIAYLEGGFQKEAYQPLEFKTAENTHKGTIAKVDGETLYVDLEKEGTIAVALREIEEIFWRGKPFAEE